MAAARTVETNGETVQVRRISWEALWKLRPDLRPANDNERNNAVPCSFLRERGGGRDGQKEIDRYEPG